MTDRDRDEKLVFGLGTIDDDGTNNFLAIGVPTKAWDYMRNGKTHTLDLRKVGVPIRLILFGCRDHAHGCELLTTGAHAEGNQVVDVRDQDLGIKPTSKPIIEVDKSCYRSLRSALIEQGSAGTIIERPGNLTIDCGDFIVRSLEPA
jgi:hypothetical protein